MSKNDKNVFEATKQWRLVQKVEHSGIDEAAKKYDLEKPKVNEIVLKAIQDHEHVIKSHQEYSIASLQKCMEDEEKKDPTMEPNSSQGGGDVLCYICGKSGHKAKDCCGEGCYECGKLGHVGRDCNENERGLFQRGVGGGGGGGICYYCGKAGYIAVCSLCGEMGHMGKECW